MSQPRQPRDISPRLVIAAVLGLLLGVFIAENTRRTRIRFIIPVVSAPLWVALVVATLVGAAAGALLARHRGER